MRWNFADRLHGHGLGQPRHALEEHVAAGEQSHQDAVHHLGLTHDDLADLVLYAVHESALSLYKLADRPNIAVHLDVLFSNAATYPIPTV